MSRALGVSALLATALTVCPGQMTGAQPANQTASVAQGFSPDDWCQQRGDQRVVHHCEERQQDLARVAALDVDPGRNGGIQVRGWSEPRIRLTTRIRAQALTESRARELAAGVRISAVDGRIRSDGPMTFDDEHWSTTFALDAPQETRLALNTRNGGITIEDFRGAATMRTDNGGITLRAVAGEMKGLARNGGLRIELTGTRWEGAGLDMETRNGAVRLTLPAGYSAELETGTVNGRVEIDFPVMVHAGRERRFTTTLGSGGPRIRAVTTNGAVRVMSSGGAQAPGVQVPGASSR
jgi:DUF4097 and DUF4098 domain-containing protein YvlB